MLGGLLAGAVLGAACESGDEAERQPAPTGVPEDGQPAPAGVPEDARAIEEDTIYAAESADGEQLLFHLSCDADLLLIVTTAKTIYAGLPCDRSLPRDVVERFLGKVVKISIRAGPPMKLFIESKVAGSVEFTVDGVWVVDTPS